MRSPLLLAPLAAVAVAASLAPAAEARHTRATAAYAYFEPATGRDARFEKGTAYVVFRTNRRLAEGRTANDPEVEVRVGGRSGSVFTISRKLRCYAAPVRIENRDKLGLGSRARVRIGRRGTLLDRQMVVERRGAGDARGGRLGCGADRKSRFVLSNLFEVPLVEPRTIFYTANAGPYVTGLRWSRWGTRRALARGTYVSECASCGEPKRLEARVILTRPRQSRSFGARAYTRQCLRTREDGVWTGRDARSGRRC